MRGSANAVTTGPGFARSAGLLAGCILVVALVILPFSLGRSGLAGPWGVAVGAVICLGAGWLSELIGSVVSRAATPIAGVVLGMGVRMIPPLVVCVWLALQTGGGRPYLPWIVYLMAFYLVTLAVETYLGLQRVAPARFKL